MVNRKIMAALAVGLMSWSLLGLAAQEQQDAKKDKAFQEKFAAGVADLGSDDFNVRESAEKALRSMGAPALPLAKAAIRKTREAEVRMRLERVVKALSLEAETDPDVLAKLARQEALKKKYAEAEKFYEKAGGRYKLQAEKTKDEAAKKELLAKAAKAEKRRKRAHVLAGLGAKGGQRGVRVIRMGGANVRIQVGGGAGAGMVAVGGGAPRGDDDW